MNTQDHRLASIPNWIIWIQCIAFVVLYAVWILPEVVGFRNTALVTGALASLYPIYQQTYALLNKRAIPFWLILALFAWATFHLLFLSQDYAAQLLEFKRIWKYAAIGAVFAFGLGISLSQKGTTVFKGVIYFGLASPVLIYLLKYVLTTYGAMWGMSPPPSLQIYFSPQPYYVPKTDYVAFCLPPMAIALGQLHSFIDKQQKFTCEDYAKLFANIGLIIATLFLFDKQNIKNGMAYAIVCVALFIMITFFMQSQRWKKIILILTVMSIFAIGLVTHTQKNNSWKTLIADAKVAFQTEQYQQWKYAGARGYPINEYGVEAINTNYERVAWFKIGNQLAFQYPFGYGLIEDSFKRMVMANWPEASPSLSHSHSGWLDVTLAVGYPGFILIIGAIFLIIFQSRQITGFWKTVVFWGPTAQSLLWVTTEVSATVTFAALIFWVCWAAGLSLLTVTPGNQK